MPQASLGKFQDQIFLLLRKALHLILIRIPAEVLAEVLQPVPDHILEVPVHDYLMRPVFSHDPLGLEADFLKKPQIQARPFIDLL